MHTGHSVIAEMSHVICFQLFQSKFMQVKSFSSVNFRRPPASIRTAFYMQHLFIHSSVYKAKQYSWDCSTNNLQKTCFLQHGSSQIEDLVIAAFLTSEKSRVLVMPFWMCLCIKNIYVSVLIKRVANIYLCLPETAVFFIGEIFFSKKLGCLHIGGDVRILAE